jgi:tetratricopeptide (TPR) repeat protein
MTACRSFVSAALALVACTALASTSRAQEAGVARIPVHVVNGRLVVGCQIAAHKRIAANLFIDYDAPVGLLLHNKAAAGIESEADDGTPVPITVFLPDLNIEVAQREAGDEQYFERFTKWYSKELGENAVVGTLGARVLSRYHVTFDLAAGFIELSAPHALSKEPPPDVAGSTRVAVTLFNDLVWFPVAFGEHRGGALGLATSKYDTWVDADLCRELHHPAGDIGAARVGDLDIARVVPFRPEEIRQRHPDGVFGMTGLDLLEHFRLEVDRVNRFARFTPSAPANFAAADVEFYKARLAEEPAPVEAWLEAHKTERLAPEAAQLLLDLQLQARADEASMRRALEFVQGTRPADLKATGALELLQKLLQTGQAKYALIAGELGLANGREDRYPDAVHKLHAHMGSIQLQQGARRDAWKHLLSAAFGLPEDGPLNLDLARCYEQDGRYSRAYSRYLQALLSAESGPAAIEGLERVQPKLDDPEAFSVEGIEKLIEGRVEGFGAATKFHPDDGEMPQRAVLVEYFTNAHFEFEIGVALGRDGLRDHFGNEYCVLVTYDVPEPELEPLVNPLSMRMWHDSGAKEIAQFADGVYRLPEAARSRFKQEVYDACRGVVMQRLTTPTDYLIEVSADVDRTGIRGSVRFNGPENSDVVAQVILIERGVLFPGKSKVVIHRNVARAALTKSLEGEPFAPEYGTMNVDFDRTWDAILAENTAFLDQRAQAGAGVVSRVSMRVDPRQASVVAVLRNKKTHEVLQAVQFDPPLPEDMK